MKPDEELIWRLLMQHATRFTFTGTLGTFHAAAGVHGGEGWSFFLHLDGDEKKPFLLCNSDDPKKDYIWVSLRDFTTSPEFGAPYSIAELRPAVLFALALAENEIVVEDEALTRADPKKT